MLTAIAWQAGHHEASNSSTGVYPSAYAFWTSAASCVERLPSLRLIRTKVKPSSRVGVAGSGVSVSVGGSGVSVGCTAVSVGGTDVLVGGMAMSVGGTAVSVGGNMVKVVLGQGVGRGKSSFPPHASVRASSNKSNIKGIRWFLSTSSPHQVIAESPLPLGDNFPCLWEKTVVIRQSEQSHLPGTRTSTSLPNTGLWQPRGVQDMYVISTWSFTRPPCASGNSTGRRNVTAPAG